MNIIRKSSSGIALLPIESELFTEKRQLFLEGEVTDEKVLELIKQIMYLISQNKDPITLYINSAGGSVNAGLALYDTITSAAKKVTIKTVCLGKAYSMGAILLCCGTKGERYLLPNSEVMIHQPLIQNGVGGNASNIKSLSESMQKTKTQLNKILAENTGNSVKKINTVTRNDFFLTAEEAIEFGLCDKICDISDLVLS